MSTAPLFHVIVCGALVNGDGKVLVARRKPDKKLGGLWEFPGGKLEPGETLSGALAREFKEELGITVTAPELWHVEPYAYPHGNVLILFYLCRDWRGEIKLTDHDELAWVTVEEMRALKLLPANATSLAKLSKELLGVAHTPQADGYNPLSPEG